MNALHEVTGRCHCGNIEYLFLSPLPKLELPIRTCDCSFCRKQGACYTSHPHGELQAKVHDQSKLNRYRFGTEAADVFLCTKCGVFPFIIGDLDNQQYAVINANSINGLVIENAIIPPAMQLESQTEEERIGRWKRAWIPKVEIQFEAPAINPAIL